VLQFHFQPKREFVLMARWANELIFKLNIWINFR